jgi:hypothetical protein
MPGIDGQPRFGVTRGPASTIVGWASVTDVAGVGDLIDSRHVAYSLRVPDD